MQATESIPAELLDLVTTNVPAHITYAKPDGSLVTNVMWVDFDGHNILTSSMIGSYKGNAFRAHHPQVAVSVVDPRSQWRRLSISGRVTDIRPDEGLAFINKLSERYTGEPYPRPNPREIYVITLDKVRAFTGRR